MRQLVPRWNTRAQQLEARVKCRRSLRRVIERRSEVRQVWSLRRVGNMGPSTSERRVIRVEGVRGSGGLVLRRIASRVAVVLSSGVARFGCRSFSGREANSHQRISSPERGCVGLSLPVCALLCVLCSVVCCGVLVVLGACSLFIRPSRAPYCIVFVLVFAASPRRVSKKASLRGPNTTRRFLVTGIGRRAAATLLQSPASP